MIKFTQNYLSKIEEVYKEAGYRIRYEKGSFKSGSCTIEDNKIIVINKFASIDIKINFLIEALKTLEVDEQRLTDKNRDFYQELKQIVIKF
jgi:hypothetical protein